MGILLDQTCLRSLVITVGVVLWPWQRGRVCAVATGVTSDYQMDESRCLGRDQLTVVVGWRASTGLTIRSVVFASNYWKRGKAYARVVTTLNLLIVGMFLH